MSSRYCAPRSVPSFIGDMTMGAGAALMEHLVVDKRTGFFVNHDLAGYEVPVHADIPYQDVIFLEEVDPTAGPLKAKVLANSASAGWRPRLRMRSTTRPGSGCASIRSRSTSCWIACLTSTLERTYFRQLSGRQDILTRARLCCAVDNNVVLVIIDQGCTSY